MSRFQLLQTSVEAFQLLDGSSFEKLNFKRDCAKICNQQGAKLNNRDQNNEFIFRENKQLSSDKQFICSIWYNYKKTSCLSAANVGDLPNPLDTDFNIAITFRVVSNVFAYTTKHTRLATTGAADKEESKYLVHL